MSNIIDGRILASVHEKKLAPKLKKLNLKIVSILVGEDPASVLYTEIKKKKATDLNVEYEVLNFPENSAFEDIVLKIQELNKDKSVNGVMVQLPLPRKFLGERLQEELLNEISPKKDVDGLSAKRKVLPAAVRAVLSILDNEKINVKDKIVTIIGASDLIGMPLSKELKKRKAKVTVCDVNTKNLREETLRADILISAAGEAGLVYNKMVTEGVVVIDVGTSKENDKIVGDVDFESVAPLASKITPVPGGVGPVTVISLMENALDLA